MQINGKLVRGVKMLSLMLKNNARLSDLLDLNET